MVFTSLNFILFFLVVLILLGTVKGKSTKKIILLMASYFFYGNWDYRFLLLIFILTLANYFVGQKINLNKNQNIKKMWLIFGIIFDVCVLGFFKYYNFFIDSFNVSKQFHLNIILPIGISFITFEVISYIVDMYKGDIKQSQLIDFALLVSFFPHLVSGPILKPKEFLPQLNHIEISKQNIIIGLQIFLFGVLKKVLIANRLAVFVDEVYLKPNIYDTRTLWLVVIAYSIQIYCDFSGYTDMAIGAARCLGLDIPKNFNMPYLSKDITEFWRRWHISLSTWLRTYLYIPLGGNRKGKLRQHVNLLIVMLLGGLWHGASWNFIFWGGLHGVALSLHKAYKDFIRFDRETILYKIASLLVTFLFVSLAWIFFRSPNIGTAFYILNKLFIPTAGVQWNFTYEFYIIPILIISHLYGYRKSGYLILPITKFYGMTIIFFLLLALLYLNPAQSSPFIYFQF
jgi:alginate O-acetyltransferase complex protein AlgI